MRVVRWGKGLVGSALLTIHGGGHWHGLIVVRAHCHPHPVLFAFVVVHIHCFPLFAFHRVVTWEVLAANHKWAVDGDGVVSVEWVSTKVV